MEDAERSHIRSFLPKLIELTECNAMLAAILYSRQIISETEKSTLTDSLRPMYEKASLLYDLVQKRTNGYANLIDALHRTNQTGAVSILEKFSKHLKYDQFHKTEDAPLYRIGNFITAYRGKFGIRPAHIKLYDTISSANVDSALKEVDILGELCEHPNIVHCIVAKYTDYNNSTNCKYFAVAFDERFTMEEVISNTSESVRLSIIEQLLIAIEFLLQNNIIHLNLKPESIFFQHQNPDPVPSIGDFRFARRLNGTATTTEVLLEDLHNGGAESYYTPEVLLVAEKANTTSRQNSLTACVSHSTDIFCLGSLIYYLTSKGKHLFGDLPFVKSHSIVEHKVNPKNGRHLLGFSAEESHNLIYKCFMSKPTERPCIGSIRAVFLK